MTRETDYLVIGAGATALSFVTTLMAEDPEARVIMIDRHSSPGGHWNDAYSFVALHQPSATYGVEGVPLGHDRIDESGPNTGFYELASGSEVLAYFQSVMRDRLLPTGRVTYFPNSDYLGGNRWRNIFSGVEDEAHVHRRVVDTTYFATSVPSTHTRRFEVADGARVEAPGKLPELWRSPDRIPDHFVILGAGKTAMDAGVWLLEAGIAPERITWVKPRESWLLNRLFTQPGPEFFEGTVGGQLAIMKAAANAESVPALFHALEDAKVMLRIDTSVEPEMFHYATISTGEVDRLRTIGNVVRKGRVERIEPGRMLLAEGEETLPDSTLFIDCTASAVRPKPVSPQWEDGKLTLQLLHVPLVTLNAAVTAFVEANFDTDEEKNALCKPVGWSDNIDGYASMLLGTGMNRFLWASNPAVAGFLARSRLDPAAPTIRWLKKHAPERLAIVGEMPAATMAAIPNLQKLAAAAQAKRG